MKKSKRYKKWHRGQKFINLSLIASINPTWVASATTLLRISMICQNLK